MFGTKSIFKSTTMWGLVSMAVPVFLQLFGYSEGESDVKAIISEGQKAVEAVMSFGGMVLVFVGRLRAKKDLVLTVKE